ncbi:MAG: sulfur carrier protein ThiS [Blastocatellia bacterium]|nr:sulfur carrier protein ThiS [Blastocatellia bacterium]
MGILVNGEPYQIAKNSRVVDLLGELNLPAERVAIELNRNLLPRTQWAETELHPGDRLEIVQFVGGG